MTRALLITLAALLLVSPASAATLPALSPLVNDEVSVFVSGQDGLLYAFVSIGRANPYQVWLLAGNQLLAVWTDREITDAPMIAIIPPDYGVGAGRVLNVCRLWTPETHAIDHDTIICTTVATDPIRLYLPALAH